MSRAVVSALAGFVGVPALLAIYLVGIERLLRQVSIRRRRALQPWLWLAPALLFVAVFLIYPVGYTLVLSCLGPASRGFVGLANYRFALTNPGMILAFQNTLLWLVGFLSVNAVDKKPVTLNDVVISPNNTKNITGTGAATVAETILLGPPGLLGGAVVRGGYVKVPVGAVEAASTKTAVTIMAS